MLDAGRVILGLDIGERVRAALVSHEQRVALCVVARVGRTAGYLDQAAIGVLTVAGRDALGDDRAARVLADVDHLRTGVGLLVVVGDSHRVEFADRVVAAQDAARVLPGDRRARLDLRPGDVGIAPPAVAALRDEVVYAALAVLVAGVPVLDRGILDPGVIQRHEFHHGGMQLVLVPHGGGATFQVTDRGAFVGDDQSALELAGVGRIDAEVGGKLHGALHALGHVNEGAIREDRRVEAGEEVVALGHHRTQVFAYQFRVFADGLGDRTEDDAGFSEFLLERGRHRDTVEHRIDGDAREGGTLMQRDAQLFIGFEQLGIHLVQALGGILLRFRGRVIRNRLVVDLRVMHVRPTRFGFLAPAAVGLQAPLAHPFRFALALRDQADYVFIQPGWNGVRFDIGIETVLVSLIEKVGDFGFTRCHVWTPGVREI